MFRFKLLCLATLLVSSFQQYAACQEKESLSEYKENKYSQFGEDGIIEKIFEIVGTESKVCIEFGAWDGVHLSNTANLWKHKGWKAVLIESDEKKVRELKKNIKGYDCIAIHKKVGFDPTDSLETILNKNQVVDPIDFLSIDVDGDDYYIFESLETLRPRVIVCEYNPTIPAEVDLYQQKGGYLGASASAIIRIAKSKGYELVAMTEPNCFFVREDLFHLFEEYETSLEALKMTKFLRFLITDYAGRYKVVAHPYFTQPYGVQSRLYENIYGDFQEFHHP